MKKYILFAIIVLAALWIFSPSVVSAVTYKYVRPGATGNGSGSDWTNAYTSLQTPFSFQRDTVYYLAFGNMGYVVMDVAESGTQRVVLKRATIADHGTGTGWSDSYASGQAVFSTIQIWSSYITIDGVTGSGTNGHGIKISSHKSPNPAQRQEALLWMPDFGIKYDILLQHIEITSGLNVAVSAHIEGGFRGCFGDYMEYEYGSYGGGRTCGGAVEAKNIDGLTLRYIYSHEAVGLLAGYSQNNILIEYCYTTTNDSTPLQHSNGLDTASANNVIVRHSVFEDIEGTAFIALLGTGESTPFHDWEVYGNIFRYSENNPAYRNGTGHGVFSTNMPLNTMYNFKFYNNTIVNINWGLSSRVWLRGGCISNCEVYNNMWYCDKGLLSSNAQGTECAAADHDFGGSSVNLGYNWYSSVFNRNESNMQNGGTSNPFVSISGKNFRLTGATTGGTSLVFPYNIDPDGNTRGADGVWDRGAYEYVSGGTILYCGDSSCNGTETCSTCPTDCGVCSDTQAPTIPANLSATAVSSSQINLSWSASTDNIGVTGYRIYRAGTQIATSQTTSYQNTGLSANTTYTYTVSAYDAAGNVSGQSASASATTQSAPTDNLLVNSDFESGFTGGIANSWFLVTDGSVVYSLSQDTGYQGSSQKIQITSSGVWGLFFYQTPAFQLNQWYNWSFWYKTQGGSLEAGITNAPHTQVVYEKQLDQTNGVWQYATLTFQYTNTGADELRFYSNSPGSYWIDNVSLTPVSADTTPPSAPTGVVVI